jgi:pimeloyl-ACP methyl ester carboxylesterase
MRLAIRPEASLPAQRIVGVAGSRSTHYLRLTMPTQSINGANLWYSESGRGPTIVLVHGFPLDSRMWEAQVTTFSSRFRVIAPDLRGFGGSAATDPFTMQSLADDLHGLLAKLNALPCILCGLSMGGYVALAYARKYPSDLRALGLIDTRAEADSPEGKANRNKMIDLVRTSGARAVADQMMAKLISDDSRQNNPAMVQKLRQIVDTCPPLTIEHALQAMRERDDQTAHLASISVPTLIVVGENDVLTPPDLSRAMHAQIRGSELVLIPNAGHMTPMETSQAFNGHLERFLAGVS